jgi:hypothetical protein
MPDTTPGLPVAEVLAALLLRELEANHAQDEHAQRLCDALGVWLDHQPAQG